MRLKSEISAAATAVGAAMCLAGWLNGGAVTAGAPVAPGSKSAAQSGMDVTTDSPAYCRSLSALIAARSRLPGGVPPGASDEVSDLKDQGDGLCQAGNVRGGINRLRRALLVLQNGRPSG